MKYRDLIGKIEAAGWRFQRQQGSHLLYRHPEKHGSVVVAGGGKLNKHVPKGTEGRAQAGGTKVKLMKYVYVIEKADDGSWSAYVPDLPGCTSCGETLEELKQNIHEAVALYIDSLREHGEPVPQPAVQADVVEAA